jgi:hypothetical protein
MEEAVQQNMTLICFGIKFQFEIYGKPICSFSRSSAFNNYGIIAKVVDN